MGLPVVFPLCEVDFVFNANWFCVDQFLGLHRKRENCSDLHCQSLTLAVFLRGSLEVLFFSIFLFCFYSVVSLSTSSIYLEPLGLAISQAIASLVFREPFRCNKFCRSRRRRVFSFLPRKFVLKERCIHPLLPLSQTCLSGCSPGRLHMCQIIILRLGSHPVALA